MRGVVFVWLALFVSSCLGVSRCSWCRGRLNVQKARRNAANIIQIKVIRSARIQSSMDFSFKTLSVNEGKTRPYKFNQEFNDVSFLKGGKDCGMIKEVRLVASRNRDPTNNCDNNLQIHKTYMISGKCKKNVFYADPCGILMEVEKQNGSNEVTERQNSGFISAKQSFRGSVSTKGAKFELHKLLPFIRAKSTAAMTMLKSHNSGSGKLDLLIEANRPQAWLHTMSKLLVLKRLARDVRIFTMAGDSGSKKVLEKKSVEDWGSEPNMPAIGKKAVMCFQSAVREQYLEVSKTSMKDSVYKPALDWFVGRGSGSTIYLMEKPRPDGVKICSLGSGSDPRTFDMLLNYAIVVMLNDHSYDKIAGMSFVSVMDEGTELGKGLYEFIAGEIATLDATRVKHFNSILKTGREKVRKTVPVDITQKKPISFKQVLKSDGGKLNQLVDRLLQDKGVMKDPNVVTLKISKEQNRLDREKLKLKQEKNKVQKLEKLPVDIKVYGRKRSGFDLKVPNKY